MHLLSTAFPLCHRLSTALPSYRRRHKHLGHSAPTWTHLTLSAYVVGKLRTLLLNGQVCLCSLWSSLCHGGIPAQPKKRVHNTAHYTESQSPIDTDATVVLPDQLNYTNDDFHVPSITFTSDNVFYSAYNFYQNLYDKTEPILNCTP